MQIQYYLNFIFAVVAILSKIKNFYNKLMLGHIIDNKNNFINKNEKIAFYLNIKIYILF